MKCTNFHPKTEMQNSKPEGRSPKRRQTEPVDSSFGLQPSDFIRPSVFGLRIWPFLFTIDPRSKKKAAALQAIGQNKNGGLR